MTKKILVLGGSGFLGSSLCNKLIKNIKLKVTNYDRKYNKTLNKKIKFIRGDISNYKKLNQQISKNDIIYHFAGISDIEEASKKPLTVVKKNILSSTLILNLCIKHKIEKFIFASSIYVYSANGSFYRISKTAVEDLIQEFHKKFNLPYLILRFGSLYGSGAPKTNGINKILYNLKFNKKLIYSGNKKTRRRYIHVDDAAEISTKFVDKSYKNSIFNITGKKDIKIFSLLNTLKKEHNIKSYPIFLNIKDENHYINTPYTFKPMKDIVLKSKKEKNFYKELSKVYLKLNK